MKQSLLGCTFSALCMFSCAHSPSPSPSPSPSQNVVGAHQRIPPSNLTATAEVVPLGNTEVSGELVLTQLEDGGVKVEGTLHGLTAQGMHGFHVHENGDCSAKDGSSAGGHFNPTHKGHGDPGSADSHVGDLGNVQADAHGEAKVFVLKKEATLAPGDTSYAGHSIIIHKQPDDLKTQPSGASGDRVGCAVVKLSS